MKANQAIVIEGDKITQIVPSSEIKAAAGDTTIDLPDATLLPGLIDMHTHLTFDLNSLGYQGLSISTAREAMHGSRNARRTLEAGFTTVRNLGAKDYADIALRDAINDGDVIGPRIDRVGAGYGNYRRTLRRNFAAAGVSLSGRGSSGRRGGRSQHRVREIIKYGADVIKICATGGVLSKGDDPNASQYTLEEMKAIVADAHRRAGAMAAHAHGAEGVRWASEARRRFGRARPLDGRCGHRHAEEKRNVSRAGRSSSANIWKRTWIAAMCRSIRSKRCAM